MEALEHLQDEVESSRTSLRSAKVHRERILSKISKLQCWRISCGGTPQDVAELIANMFSGAGVQ